MRVVGTVRVILEASLAEEISTGSPLCQGEVALRKQFNVVGLKVATKTPLETSLYVVGG